jgi:hypothetical protein
LRQIGVLVHPPGGQAEAGGQTREMGEGQAAVGAATHDVVGEVVLLGLADRVIAIIVQHEDLHRQVAARDGLQFLQIHHDRPVPGQADDPPARRVLAMPGVIGAKGSGQIIAHRGTARVGIEPLAFLQIRCLEDGDAGRAVAGDDDIVLFNCWNRASAKM